MPTDNPDDGSQDPSNAPKYVTAEEIGNIVNAAVTSHLKRSLAGAIDAALKPVVEKLSAVQAPVAPPADPEEGGKAKKGKQDPEVLAMAKRIEDMEKALATEREATAAAQRQSRDERAFSELMTALDGKVRPEFRDMLAKHLFHLEKRIEVDETGRALFKTSKVPAWGGEPEDQFLPIADGVTDFLRSDAAKAFLPAPNPGSGAGPLPTPARRGPAGPPPPVRIDPNRPMTDLEKVRLAGEMEARAAAALGLKQ